MIKYVKFYRNSINFRVYIRVYNVKYIYNAISIFKYNIFIMLLIRVSIYKNKLLNNRNFYMIKFNI